MSFLFSLLSSENKSQINNAEITFPTVITIYLIDSLGIYHAYRLIYTSAINESPQDIIATVILSNNLVAFREKFNFRSTFFSCWLMTCEYFIICVYPVIQCLKSFLVARDPWLGKGRLLRYERNGIFLRGSSFLRGEINGFDFSWLKHYTNVLF